MSKKLTVEHKKIGRHKAVGLAYEADKLIIIDSRQKGKDYIDTVIHELLHVYRPEMAEEEVVKLAGELTDALWNLKIRKIEE